MNKQPSPLEDCDEEIKERLDKRINHQAELLEQHINADDVERIEHEMDRNIGAIDELTDLLRSHQNEAKE